MIHRVKPIQRAVACYDCCRKFNDGTYHDRFRLIKTQALRSIAVRDEERVRETFRLRIGLRRDAFDVLERPFQRPCKRLVRMRGPENHAAIRMQRVLDPGDPGRGVEPLVPVLHEWIRAVVHI